MDQIEQAVYDTVHGSGMKAKQIAATIGMSHQVLLNKANAQNDTHKLTLLEAVAIQLVTKSNRIHRAMGLELDAKAENPAEPKTLIDAVMLTIAEHGDVVRVVQETMQDGLITSRERENCLNEIDEAIEALADLRASVSKHADSINLKTVR